jgi:hypothetical protein
MALNFIRGFHKIGCAVTVLLAAFVVLRLLGRVQPETGDPIIAAGMLYLMDSLQEVM